MSLVLDGVWKGSAAWASTVWAQGVWFEGTPTPPSPAGFSAALIPVPNVGYSRGAYVPYEWMQRALEESLVKQGLLGEDISASDDASDFEEDPFEPDSSLMGKRKKKRVGK